MDKRTITYVLILTATFFLLQYFFFPSRKEQTPPEAPVVEKQAPLKEKGNLYVLENDAMQLVFSDQGGSIAEINLPFASKTNNSQIHPTEIDRSVAKASKEDNLFPLFPYQINGKKELPSSGGFYPLLRRSVEISPAYYAGALVDEDLTPPPRYSLIEETKASIIFRGTENNRTITKTYTLSEASYCFDLSIEITGEGAPLYLASGLLEVELSGNREEHLLKTRIQKEDKYSVDKLSLPKNSLSLPSLSPEWVCTMNPFFSIIVEPLSGTKEGFIAKSIKGCFAPTRISLIDQKYNLYPEDRYPAYLLLLPAAKKSSYRFFAGPMQASLLRSIDDQLINPSTKQSPNFASAKGITHWYSFISEPFAKFLFLLMQVFFKITNSWGVAILLLTIALRLMLYPLNSWSIRSMGKMQELGPEMEAINKKYAKDPERKQKEIMRLYREKGANPFTGCFPIFIQMPIIFGMLSLLRNTFELRGVSFIPGWINDLSAPDVLFTWSYPIPLVGTQFHLLPFLSALVMYIQQKFFSKVPKDKSKWTDQQKQGQVMYLIMNASMLIFTYTLPSGLNIYWTFSTLLGILQQWWIQRKNPTGGSFASMV